MSIEKYCFDNNKSKYKTFSKSDFYLIKASVKNDYNNNTYGVTYVPLPQGFTYENTIILSAIYDSEVVKIPFGNDYTVNAGVTHPRFVVNIGDITGSTEDSKNIIAIYNYETSGSSLSEKNVEILIMKVENL